MCPFTSLIVLFTKSKKSLEIAATSKSKESYYPPPMKWDWSTMAYQDLPHHPPPGSVLSPVLSGL